MGSALGAIAIGGPAALAIIQPQIVLPLLGIAGCLGWLRMRVTSEQQQAFAERIIAIEDRSRTAADILEDIRDGTIELKVDLDDLVKGDVADALAGAQGDADATLRPELYEEILTALAENASKEQLEFLKADFDEHREITEILAWTNDRRGREIHDLVRDIVTELEEQTTGLQRIEEKLEAHHVQNQAEHEKTRRTITSTLEKQKPGVSTSGGSGTGPLSGETVDLLVRELCESHAVLRKKHEPETDLTED